jgi:hypothetical protein
MIDEIDGREALERELYWAADASPGSRRSTRDLRMALHELAVLSRMLADRLADAEAEIQRLRDEREGRDSGTAG